LKRVTLNSQFITLNSLGEDGSFIPADEFSRLNKIVFELTNELFDLQASSAEEEAELCVALLQGLNATIYSSIDKQEKVQKMLDRSADVLNQLDNSTLKCELLLICYQIVEDYELMKQAKEVIISWGGRELTEEEQRMMAKWNELSI